MLLEVHNHHHHLTSQKPSVTVSGSCRCQNRIPLNYQSDFLPS